MIFKKWVDALIEPKLTFAEEKPKATLGKAIKMIFVAGVIAGIFGVIANYIHFSLTGKLFSLSYYPYSLSHIDFFGRYLSLHEYLTLSFASSIVLTPIIFLISSGIIYPFAKLFKGKGNFTTQTYLIALFYAPCMIIASALIIIPFLGMLLGLLVLIYELYLLTLALKETHRYSTKRAILTWLMPLIVLIFIACVLSVVWLISTIPYMATR